MPHAYNSNNIVCAICTISSKTAWLQYVPEQKLLHKCLEHLKPFHLAIRLCLCCCKKYFMINTGYFTLLSSDPFIHPRGGEIKYGSNTFTPQTTTIGGKFKSSVKIICTELYGYLYCTFHLQCVFSLIICWNVPQLILSCHVYHLTGLYIIHCFPPPHYNLITCAHVTCNFCPCHLQIFYTPDFFLHTRDYISNFKWLTSNLAIITIFLISLFVIYSTVMYWTICDVQ